MGLIYVADSQAYPQGGKTTTTIPDHGLSRDRKKAHSNGGRHIDWTQGPCHDRSASNNSEICLRRAFTGKRGKGKGNKSRISPRKTSENVPHKAVGRESRRNSSGDDARILNARLVCQTMVTRCNPPREVIPLTGFPIDWRRTGRQKKPRPEERESRAVRAESADVYRPKREYKDYSNTEYYHHYSHYCYRLKGKYSALYSE